MLWNMGAYFFSMMRHSHLYKALRLFDPVSSYCRSCIKLNPTVNLKTPEPFDVISRFVILHMYAIADTTLLTFAPVNYGCGRWSRVIPI